MLCENCVHKNVCRYKTEFDNLKNDIAEVAPTWAPDRYIISIQCKNYSRDAATILADALKAKKED